MRNFVLILIGMLICAGCGPKSGAKPAEAPGVKKISAEEAVKTWESIGDHTILDVRAESEYAEGHVPGAVLLPDNEISARAGEVLPDKNKPVFVYCRSGRRSAGAAQTLAGMGYTAVYDFGGILNWPYEIEK